ncbi:hypothetical protein [Rhizobium nepotum]|uniref:hypothetical protein n=1 Tax=Rhizobium nepotum TaxID=1035271 RepID=UPI003CFA836A
MTYLAFEDGKDLNEIAEALATQLEQLTAQLVAAGRHATLIITERDPVDTSVSFAVVSTMDDHEELLTTLDEVIEDVMGPYEDDFDEEEPELPFEKATVQ